MTIDDDYPIFLIVPELLDFDKERNHEQSAAFLSQLFLKIENGLRYLFSVS